MKFTVTLVMEVYILNSNYAPLNDTLEVNKSNLKVIHPQEVLVLIL